MNLAFKRDEIERSCRSNQIVRLEVVGAYLDDDFDRMSPLGLLATLKQEARPSLLDWIRIQEELGKNFEQPIRLLSRRAVERSGNPYRKTSILTETKILFADE